MNTAKLFFDKKIITAAVIYFSISEFLLFKYGIQLSGEAEKFIENANRILNGQELFNGVFGYFYIVYTLLVALFLKLSVNLVFVAVFQVILSFAAAVCLYKLLKQVLGNSNIAFLFFIVYLLCYPIQKWNFFLYSESIHTSLLVIGIYLFNNWLNNKNYKSLTVLIVISLLILFSRPVGILFLMSLFITMLFWVYQNKRKLLFFVLLSVTIVSVILILNSPFTAFINPDSIRRMEIICQVPETDSVTVYHEYNRQGLYKAFTVIKNEIGVSNFFKNGFKKLAYFFGMYRSYYSWKNNLLLICFTIFYPLALLGIFYKQRKQFYYARLFAVTYLFSTSAGIFFTCDEWSNRFISPAFPFILILAAAGVSAIYDKMKSIKISKAK